ncbi:hypothetical protein RND81_05G013800, partial [Saponaria officinalis]
RGLNAPSKQQEIRAFLLHHRVDLVEVLETRVKEHNALGVQRKVFPQGWKLASNYPFHDNGRIWIAWKSSRVYLDVLGIYDQLICYSPCVLMGDFNVTLYDADRNSSYAADRASIEDFRKCCANNGLVDLPYTGLTLTWCNKQAGLDRTWCKLHRVMGNAVWFQNFGVAAVFLPPGISDHSPALLNLESMVGRKRGSFKFLNGWLQDPRVHTVIQEAWEDTVKGTKMFQLVSKLKGVKRQLQDFHRSHFSNISHMVILAREALALVQSELNLRPCDDSLIEREKSLLQALLKVQGIESSFFQQRAKIHYIQQHDENTKFFQAKMKENTLRNKVYSICTLEGNVAEKDDDIGQAFVDFYTGLLGSSSSVLPPTDSDIEGERVGDHLHQMLAHPISDMEIKEALFGIPEDKAPRLDGFNSVFFKSSWDTINPCFIAVVKDFFQHQRLLKQVNSTLLTLVPKVPSPANVTQFRPIACCNVIYMVISKIIVNRLKLVLPLVI